MVWKRSANYKKTTKTTKKRYSKKPKSLAVIPRSMVDMGKGFPKKITMTHKYVDVVTVTSTAGSFAKYLFSCNNVYDPNYTSTGHQPMYRDQMAGIYNHYTVIGSKASFRVLNSASNTGLLGCVLFINDSTTVVPVDIGTATEQTQSKKMGLIPYGASAPINLSAKWSARKFFGKGVLANTNLGASAGTSPAEQSYYTFCLQCLDGASTVSVYVEVEIEYITIWSELQALSAS